MAYYCGIDLHSNNHVVVVIDDEDNRVYEKCLANDLTLTLRALERYKALLYGISSRPLIGTGWLWRRGRTGSAVYYSRLILD